MSQSGAKFPLIITAAKRKTKTTNELMWSKIDETRKGDPVNIGDLPDWERGGGYNNIMALLMTATPEEVDYWRNWYGNAHADVEALATKYDEPFDLVAAAVAVLSPGNTWKSNLRAAENILLEVHDDKMSDERDGNIKYRKLSAYPKNAEKARNILITGNASGFVTGPKVAVFYNSLIDPASTKTHMVLDGHAINIWRGVKVPLKSIRYPQEERETMIRDYKRAAADSGLGVQEVQAITWFLWKTSTQS
jgi:hypothetical protein